jgi:iron complex transport system ATP-binding protein
MIILITGPLHSGKTTFIRRELVPGLINKGLSVGGYVSPAVFEGEERRGYDLLDLKTGQLLPFLRKEGESGWQRIGAYYFLPSGLEKAEGLIRDFQGDVCIIDEIGPMELAGGGLWPAIGELLARDHIPMLLIVRDFLADLFPALFPGRRTFVFGIKEDNTASRITTLLRPKQS